MKMKKPMKTKELGWRLPSWEADFYQSICASLDFEPCHDASRGEAHCGKNHHRDGVGY